jgi:hypothetical protein
MPLNRVGRFEGRARRAPLVKDQFRSHFVIVRGILKRVSIEKRREELRPCYRPCSGTPCKNRHLPFNTNNSFSYIFHVLNECLCVFKLCCECML